MKRQLGLAETSADGTEQPEGSKPPARGSLSAKPERPSRVLGARVLIAGFLVALILSVVGATYFRIERQLRETLERQLETLLEENVHAVSAWLTRHEQLAFRAANLKQVEDTVAAYQAGVLRQEGAAKKLTTDLGPLFQTGEVESVAVVSTTGKLWFSSRTSESTRSPTQLAPVLEQLKSRRGTAQLHRDGENLVLRSTAFVGPKNSHAAVLEVTTRIGDQVSIPRAFQRQGTYVFDRERRYRSNGATGEGDSIPEGFRRALAVNAFSTETQVENYARADGVRVVGAWTWISDRALGVATELPEAEALRSITRLRHSFLVLVTLVGAAVVGFIALGRWTLRVRQESELMTQRLGRLARAIQPLSAALEHDPSAVVLVDGEGVVVYANASSHRVLGVSAPLLGQDVDEVFHNLHAELQAAVISGRDSIVAQGTGTDDETLLVSSRSLTIDGNPHFLYMLRPVTQQVRRQEVEHWKKLIRVLSHELNNALAPITSLLSSARKVNQMTHQDPRLGQIFESIAERTGHLVSFIEGYREVARLPTPSPRHVSWELFLEGLKSQTRFVQVGATPQAQGYFDPVQLERVLINVVNNACEADSPPDEVTIEVLEEPGGFRVNVSDRGTGMPEPVLRQAMLPFFSTKRTGTGVGLALSREIIEAHGGQLTLTNRQGGGLVVSCFLPHPVQAPTHASRSRLPISIVPATEPEQ